MRTYRDYWSGKSKIKQKNGLLVSKLFFALFPGRTMLLHLLAHSNFESKYDSDSAVPPPEIPISLIFSL